MAKYKAVPSDEVRGTTLPCAGARTRGYAELNAKTWTDNDDRVTLNLYDPSDPDEYDDWMTALVQPWAVVEDRDLYINGVRVTSDNPLNPVGGDQKVTRAAADGKARVELIPMHAILGLADAFNYGALKYQEGNWELAATDPTARKRYAAALIRHGLLIIAGEVLDPESGLPHWDMAAASCGIGRETDPETRGKRFKMKEPPK